MSLWDKLVLYYRRYRSKLLCPWSNVSLAIWPEDLCATLLFFKRAVCFCHPSSEQVFVSLGVEWSRTSTVYLVLYCLYSLRDEVKHRDDPRVLEISLEPATEELGHRDWLKDCVAGDTSAIDVPSIFVVATTSSSTENLAADDDGWCDTRPGLTSVGVRVNL